MISYMIGNFVRKTDEKLSQAIVVSSYQLYKQRYRVLLFEAVGSNSVLVADTVTGETMKR